MMFIEHVAETAMWRADSQTPMIHRNTIRFAGRAVDDLERAFNNAGFAVEDVVPFLYGMSRLTISF